MAHVRYATRHGYSARRHGRKGETPERDDRAISRCKEERAAQARHRAVDRDREANGHRAARRAAAAETHQLTLALISPTGNRSAASASKRASWSGSTGLTRWWSNPWSDDSFASPGES